VVAAITLVGLLLRLRSIGNSLFGDELSTYSIVTTHSLGGIIRTLDGHSVDLTPPLYFVLAWLAERLGNSPELLRLPALISGTATIPLTFLVGKRTVGRSTGIVGALLVALSPFLIFYSTEARAYALVTCLVLASTLALLEAVESNRIGWWASYALLACAAMYAHYTAVFALGAQLLWALAVHRQRVRGLLAASLAAAIGFVPWLPALIKNTNSFGTKVFQILDPFGIHSVAHDLAHWAVGHPYIELSAEPGTVAIALILAGLGTACLLRLRQVQKTGLRREGPGQSSAWLLLALLAVSLPAGMAIYSIFRDSVWDLRNLITSWPGWALLMGAILTTPRRPIRYALVGLVAVGFALGAAQLLRSRYERPDYAAAARYVLAHGGRSDPVAIIPTPSPGPYSAMDAAFAYQGDPGRPLLRVGSPSLAAVLAAPPYAILRAPSAAQLAAQTEAGDEDKVFVIAPGTASVAQLLRSGTVNNRAVLGPTFGTGVTGALLGTIFPPLSAYMKAISNQFVPVQTTQLPGFLPLSVYTFKRR
jgi:4-amino-4-deoxy-L-arabinose transferase-like glycosyltransferase